MISNITIMHTQTGDTLKINNTFQSLEQCIEHLEYIKRSKDVIILDVHFPFFQDIF